MTESRDALLWTVRQVALRTDLRIALAKHESLQVSLRRCGEALVEHLGVGLAAFWALAPTDDELDLVSWVNDAPANADSKPAGPGSNPLGRSDEAPAPDGLPRRVPISSPGGLGTAVRELHAYVTNDLIGEPTFADRGWVLRERFVALACYPLLASDRPMGAMAIFSRHPLAENALEVLAWVADLISVSIESRRVGEELRQAVAVKEAEGKRREEAQSRLALQHRVAEVLASAQNQVDATTSLVRDVAQQLGWELGLYWRLDNPGVARKAVVWHAVDPGLAELTAALEGQPAGPQSVVGRVRATGGPVWITGEPLAALAEAPLVRRAGIRTAIGFPVVSEAATPGVFEFLTRAAPAPDDALLHALSTIGRQVGEFIRRKVVEEQLIQSQKMEAVGKLAGGVAHDFNNILTVITGYAAMALETVNPEDPLYDQVSEILSASERASSLVNQLLAFSRKQVFHPRLIDLNVVITDMERMLRRLIGEDVRLVTRKPDRPSPVRADLVHLEQVIVNLAVNARDAMPGGGRLSIEVAHVDAQGDEQKNSVRITVRDTGIGMSEEIRNRAFDPFFTTKDPGKGTGLGLSTVYGLVRQNGGQIRVESEPGKGAQFVILLPRVTQEIELPAAKSARALVPRGTETILLVEDEKPVRRLARNILKASGYDVVEAGSGAEALQICRKLERPIHLLLTDVVMPGMNGVELSRQLDGACRDVRVLYMSGYAEDALFEGYSMDRSVAFLEKPFTPASLSAKVRQVLDAAPTPPATNAPCGLPREADPAGQ